MYLARDGSGCGVLVSLAVAGILIFWLHDRCQSVSQYNARGTPWTTTRSANEANPRLFFMVLNFKMISVLLIGRDWRIGYNNTGCSCIAYTTVLPNTLWLPIRKLSICGPTNLYWNPYWSTGTPTEVLEPFWSTGTHTLQLGNCPYVGQQICTGTPTEVLEPLRKYWNPFEVLEPIPCNSETVHLWASKSVLEPLLKYWNTYGNIGTPTEVLEPLWSTGTPTLQLDHL